MHDYTIEIVTRYRHSPAIWAWEFGNEFNLPADLPNADRHRPKINLRGGTPAERSAADDISGEQVVSALRRFAVLARELDPHRPILSGNSAPRPYAWHNWKEQSWTRDSRAQYAEMLARDNPNPMDMLSIHVYPGPGKTRFEDDADIYELIRESMRVSETLKKPLFLGEFGANEQLFGEATRQEIEKLLDTIVQAQVPLSAFWVWGLDSQEDTFNVNADNHRVYVLDLIGEANHRLNSENP